MKIGIDVGGTFTDFLLTLDDGTSEIYKVLSTPEDPSIGVMNGLNEMAENKGLPMNEFIKKVDTIVHGTTVTTNAVLTYNGAKTGLITTKGFRDILETGNEIRYDLYDLNIEQPMPLVPRRYRLGISDRINSRGEIVKPLEMDVIPSFSKYIMA